VLIQKVHWFPGFSPTMFSFSMQSFSGGKVSQGVKLSCFPFPKALLLASL
jgi:hypothetical protein